MTTLGRKPRGSPSDKKMKVGNMDMFKYEHIKNTKITENLNLYKYSQATSEVNCPCNFKISDVVIWFIIYIYQ